MTTKTTTLKRLLLATAIMLLAFAPSAAFSAVTMYLELEGVDGDVTAQNYQGQIQVLEWSWALSRSVGDLSSRRRGDVNVQDVSITAFNSKATPKLIEGLTTGKVYPRAVLSLVNPATGVRVEQLELANVAITSVETGVSAGAERPVSTVTLKFTQFRYTYTEIGRDGSVKGNVETQFDIASGTTN
jgi:type VI protein secretion system component Hcp